MKKVRKIWHSGDTAVPINNNEENKKNHKWFNVILMLFVLVFLVSAGMTVYSIMKYESAKNEFLQLSNQVKEYESVNNPENTVSVDNPENAVSVNTEAEIYDEYGMLKAYAPLYEQNKDMFGWIRIKDTVIDYPVMFTPEDPEYYIDRDFEKKWSASGVPFIGQGYSQSGGHAIIYSHNMKNGTMFASIVKYNDKEYYNEHPLIEFDTLYKKSQYEIIGAFYSKAYYKDEVGVFRFYNYTDLSDEVVFNEYVEQVKAASLYDTEETAEYGDELITLSTCSYNEKNGRFVVVAKKIN